MIFGAVDMNLESVILMLFLEISAQPNSRCLIYTQACRWFCTARIEPALALRDDDACGYSRSPSLLRQGNRDLSFRNVTMCLWLQRIRKFLQCDQTLSEYICDSKRRWE